MKTRTQISLQTENVSTLTAGNTGLLQRKCACGGKAGLTGQCAQCRRSDLIGNKPPLIQTKLRVNTPGDQYEQEADRVAAQVMRMPDPKLQRQIKSKNQNILQTKPVLQRQTEEGDEEEILQTKPLVHRKVSGSTSGGTQAPPIVNEALQSSGRPLDKSTRNFLESRFGHDFSNVRIHTDSKAAESARSVNARAYTVGHNIVFGHNQYSSTTFTGRSLLAHELTHTIQQGGKQVIQRAPLSDEKKEQLRIDASKTALDFLSKLTEIVENLSDDERKRFVQYINQAQAAAKEALSIIEKSNIEHKDIASKFIEKWSASFDFEPYAYLSFTNESFWQLGGKTLNPQDFIKAFAVKQKSVTEDSNIEKTRALAQSLSNPRQHFLNLTAGAALEQILEEDKTIDRKDFFSDSDDEKKDGGIFISPTANEMVDQIEDETGEEFSDEKKQELSEIDEEKLKQIRELMKQEGKDLDAATKKRGELTELELEVLTANMLLNEGKTKAEGISLNMGDLQDVTDGGGLNELENKLSEIQNLEDSILAQIKNDPNGKKVPKSNFSLLEIALRSFQAEIVMMKGLLRGAKKRNPELGTFETELNTAFTGLMKEVQKEMLTSSAFDLLLIITPGGALIALGKKIKKVIDLIAVIRQGLAITEEFAKVKTKLAGAQTQFDDIQKMIKKADEFDQEEIEEEIFKLIEDHKLEEILHLPDLEGLSEEDAQARALDILREIPKGADNFTKMQGAYSDLPPKPEPKDLAMLGVKSLQAGVTLSPVVSFLALKLLENIDAAKAQVAGKSVWDRLTKSKKGKKSTKERRKEKKEKSDKKRKKLDTRGVEYIKSEIENVISNNYKPRILKAVQDNKNSLGNHSWTEAYFKDFVENEVKDINRERTKLSVKAWKKPTKKKKSGSGSKVETKAPMVSIKVSFKTNTTPWTIVIKTKKAKAEVKMQPSSKKVKEMSHESFSEPGIPYEINIMKGKDKPNKRRKITSWLMHRKQGYQWTYGVDASGNEMRTPDKTFIRMKGGETKPGFIRIKKGFIVQNIDPNAYKDFLGKQLSGKVKSRVNTRKISGKLPPGYAAKKSKGEIIIYGKKGSGTEEILSWDDGLLAKGKKKRQPNIVSPIKPDAKTAVKERTMSPLEIDQMVDNMFEKDSQGSVKTPEKVKSQFKSQGKTTRKSWKKYINNREGLKIQPTRIEADLGYTINVNRKATSGLHLPELKTTDDRGHLIAARFSGSTNANKLDTFKNLIPMNAKVNQSGAWQKIEREMAQVYIGAAAKAGDYVNVSINPVYVNYIRRPDKINITWKHKRSGTNIKTKTESVDNS